LSTAESRYIEKKSYLSRYTHEQTVAARESDKRSTAEFSTELLRSVKEELPGLIPFLTKKCGVKFRGRILEIGAGGAWFSAVLSRLPNVVELVVTDFSPKLLKEQAPRIFKLLDAKTAKITRTPGDFHQLDFPDDHFDFVVCAAVLHHATNMVQLLREVKRVLKPGGQFVAIHEPVWPVMKPTSRAKLRARLAAAGVVDPFYTLADYKEFFVQAGLPVEARRINLARGFRYYVKKLVTRLSQARYAFVGTKRNGQKKPAHSRLALRAKHIGRG
jgi:ubiquinone/menaquinone biosynthesis C-methylase UbiE